MCRHARSGASAGQAVEWDQGRWAAGVARVETKKKEKKRDNGRRICLAAARKNDADLSRSRLPWRDNGTWTSTRQITRRPPMTCIEEALEGLRDRERGEEGAGNDDGVGVVR